MKGQIIPQNMTIKPIVETHYICPVEGCKRDLGAVTEEEAIAHVNQPIIELPLGLVVGQMLWDRRKTKPKPRVDSYHKVRSLAEEELNELHYAVYNSVGFGVDDVRHYLERKKEYKGHCDVPVYRFWTISMQDLIGKRGFSLLTEEEFDTYLDLDKNVHGVGLNKEIKGLAPVRTTPELEEMLARMKAEKR